MATVFGLASATCQHTVASRMVRSQWNGSAELDGAPHACAPPYPALNPERLVTSPTALTRGPSSARRLCTAGLPPTAKRPGAAASMMTSSNLVVPAPLASISSCCREYLLTGWGCTPSSLHSSATVSAFETFAGESRTASPVGRCTRGASREDGASEQ